RARNQQSEMDRSIIAQVASGDRQMRSSDKVAIVTGAGSGIGRQVAIALMHQGYAVALAGRRKEPLEATAEAARASGTPTPNDSTILSLIWPTDVSDPA